MNPALILCLALTARAEEPALSRFSYTEPHMGTRFQVIVHARDEATARKAARAAFARVSELNAIMSDYLSTSELMQLCGKAGGPAVKVSDELFTVLARSARVARESEGAFDVTVGPLVRLWRVARKTGRLPDARKLEAARALVSPRLVELDQKARTVRLLRPAMQLDLGGIGKGYAADEMQRVLKQHGITRALVAAGGDITVSDPPPGKPGWTIAIAAVDAKKEGPRYLILANAAVSSSGDAEQFVEIGGKRYSHLIDPRTGLGLEGRMSATVVAPDGITADSLTKVVAILGPEKGFRVLERYKGVSARYVHVKETGISVLFSKGFPKLHPGG